MNARLFAVAVAFLVLLIALVTGCGGSTSGTGGVTVEGRLLTVAAAPVPDVTVTILETGDSAITDTSGNFTIATLESVSTPQFLFEGIGVNARVAVSEIESDVSSVHVEFELSEGSVRSREVDIRSRRGRGNDRDTRDGGGVSGGSNDSQDDSGGRVDDEIDDDSRGGDRRNDGVSHGGSGDDEDDEDSGSGNSGGGGSGHQEEGRRYDFTAVIQALTATTITVQDVVFVITAETEIRDDRGRAANLAALSIGQNVRIRGESVAGVITAERVEVEDED